MTEAAIVICMKRMAPNPDSADVCSGCGMSLIEANMLDPVGTLFDQGVAHSQAIYRPTKLIVVFTIWLLSLPALIGSLFGVGRCDSHAGLYRVLLFMDLRWNRC